ncbi:hypothetical protein BG261_05980 [Floricoccus tropicus]|uniref:Uncharacterized protein n=1 Tax=Floricoccus tropicus TaxID=1859473 RepID=A0A1E8GJL9_9LACT|nr:oligosaccharide flippase family protein [Floricoccus tropicus]OFI48454.1 hypothetical protein BG261_05980 [Floricoccus tropicus]
MEMIRRLKGINILIISSLIGKILSALYRFPYQNIVGDLGFYAYQQVYPFYAIITTLSLTALPNFLSSLLNTSDTSEEDESQFFQVTLIISLVSFIILTVLSIPLARAMGTEKLATSLICSITPLLLVPFLSLYRGVKQSQLDMTTTAISQVLEQTIRVTMIILAALTFLVIDEDVYRVSSLAMLGSFLAGLVTLIYLISKSDIKFKNLFKDFTNVKAKFTIIKRFGLSSLVFVFFMIYMLIMQLIDVFTVKDALVASGISSDQAEILKGIYDRGQPFLQLGLVFVTSIFTNALPRLTLDKSEKKIKNIFDLTVYLSITLTVGLMILLPQMNQVLFKSNSQSTALIIFVSQVALIGIVQFYHHLLFLEGRNKQSGIILIIGLVLKIFLSPLLTREMGLSGASLSSVISISFILIAYILVSKKFPAQIFNLRFIISLILMAATLMIGSNMFHVEHRFMQLIKLVIISVVSAGVFLLSAKKLKAFSNDLWEELGL